MIFCQQLSEGGRLFWTQFFEYFTILGLASLGGYSLYKAYKGERLWVSFQHGSLLKHFFGEKRADIINNILCGSFVLVSALYFLWEKLLQGYKSIPSIDVD